MPFELSGTDIVLFVISVGAFMAYHTWFFVSTTIADSHKARTEEEEAALLARLEAVRQGQLIELEDHRQARGLRTPEP